MSSDLWIIVFIFSGIGLLYIGAELLVQCGSAVALRLGVPPLIVGLTIAAFGTSSPELVVSLKAAVAGSDSIALGNVVGSNITNIGLILGLAAILNPMRITLRVIRWDIPLMIAASLVFVALIRDGELGRVDGGVLTAGLVAYICFVLKTARKESSSGNGAVLGMVSHTKPVSRWTGWIGILAGLGMLAAGAHFFVTGAVMIARLAGLSEALIGLTIVAIGTSLPEFATSALAAVKGEADLAVGNIVGSNLFNILGILGIAALITPLKATGMGLVDYSVMTLLAVMLLPLCHSGFRLDRWEGALMLLVFIGYLGYLIQMM